jgi:hypothetical protein
MVIIETSGASTYDAALRFTVGDATYHTINHDAATGSLDFIYNGTTTILQLDDSGFVYMPTTYDATVGGTNRDLFIDNTGKLGYVSSSLRYKENVDYDYDSSFIYDLKPCTFRYKSGSGGLQYGLIAEDVEKVNSDFVSYNDNDEVETVNYKELITPLLMEIKKLRKEINELKGV